MVLNQVVNLQWHYILLLNFKKAGDKCLLADFEYSFDADYASKIGVDIDDLIIIQPDTMEDGYNIIHGYIYFLD